MVSNEYKNGLKAGLEVTEGFLRTIYNSLKNEDYSTAQDEVYMAILATQGYVKDIESKNKIN